MNLPRTAVLLLAAATAVPLTLSAGDSAAPRERQLPVIQVVHAQAAPPACIVVEVDGVRAPAWTCLQHKLSPTPARRAPARTPEAERLMRQPGNQMLQYNLEGTRQRMGNALGTSVQPQRPAR